MILVKLTCVIFLIADLSYGSLTPEDLDNLAEAKAKEAQKERADADKLNADIDLYAEMSDKMRRKAYTARPDDADTFNHEADRVDQKFADAPARVEEKRRKANDLSREAEEYRREAENLRSAANAE